MCMFTITAGIAAGLYLLYRIQTLEKQNRDTDSLRRLSIIIPARNEEQNIGRLLHSLKGQYPAEILVVDDGSEDKTAEIAAACGAEVMHAEEPPEGWLGKSWACFSGAKKAKGEWLMFLDADTFFEEFGAEKTAAAFLDQGASGILSIHPYHSIQKPYESLSAFFHLAAFSAMGAFRFLQRKGVSYGAFGQCMICTKQDYFNWGGHGLIKDKVAENMELAVLVSRTGAPVRCMSGKGALSMRMYPDGPASLIAGFSKTFASGAKATNWKVLLPFVLWVAGCMSFLTEISMLSNLQVYALLYAAAVLHIWMTVRKIGSFGIITALFFPFHAVFFMLVFLTSFWRTFISKSASWKGRKIIVKEDAK